MVIRAGRVGHRTRLSAGQLRGMTKTTQTNRNTKCVKLASDDHTSGQLVVVLRKSHPG